MRVQRKFPLTRLRRNRSSSRLRKMLAENELKSSDLIQPLFVKENLNGFEPIDSLPGIQRIGLDEVNQEIHSIEQAGIQAVALFPVIEESKKDLSGSLLMRIERMLWVRLARVFSNPYAYKSLPKL